VQAHWLTQRFDDPAAEAELRRDWAERTLRQVRWAFGLGVLMIVAFGLLDLALVPEALHQTWLIRYAFMAPSGLAMVFTYTFFRLRLVVAAPVCLSYTAAYLVLLALPGGPPGPVTVSNAVVVVTFNLIGGAVCYFLEQAMRRDFLQRRLIAQQAERLAESLGKVKVLTGLLPICAWCHDVHAEDGTWQRIEAYLADRSDASFTHGICPSCQAKVAAERS